ncbi:MAG TPA: hypothetical protein VLH56_08935 [Dissulfurispiraceae bacterium]|nr:hypothetical protein [Dissulfurispiraceae bacterium]
MTVTYNLANADPQIVLISLVRLEIGDTTLGAGVRPDGSNLSDEEISVWLQREGDDILRSTAAACEALSRQWANMANITLGPRKEELGKISDNYARRAEQLRERAGGSDTTFSSSWAKQDGYHDRRLGTDYRDPYGSEAQ